MTPPGQILIVDDDPEFALIYRELLEEEGLAVIVTHDARGATELLEGQGHELDVVLLDQKLKGPGGPESGLDLIAVVGQLAPFAKIIVATGYPEPGAIERAFALGVYDYLVKNGAFDALLKAKVRNAVEITRERRLAALSKDQTDQQLRALWKEALIESDRNRKGLLLEQLVALLFRATPGFERVETRLHNRSEEIDIVIENRADSGPWSKEGSVYLIGECKNWSKPCGPNELAAFQRKLRNKFGRIHTGFFFAPGGFTEGFHTARKEDKQGELLIIPADGDALERWIESEDRLAFLTELYKSAVFDTGS